MNTKRFFPIFTFLVLATLACGLFDSSGEEAPTPDLGPLLTGTALAIAQAELEIKQATVDAMLDVDVQAPSDNQEVASVQDTEPPDQDDAAPEPAETEEPPAADQDEAQATAEAQDMYDTLQELQEDGVVSSLGGEFIPVEDFTEEIAKINYITWFSFDFEPPPVDFVIKADVAWSSASDIANWPFAGCGFVFSEEDNSNFHLAYLSLDGYGFLKKWVNGEESVVAKQYYGSVPIPEGEAEIILAVQGDRAAFYVDGREVFNQYDGHIKPGNLALTVLSGTNKGYGTRCEMTNMGIWLLE